VANDYTIRFSSGQRWFSILVNKFNSLFPLWAILFSLMAFFNSSLFADWQPAIVPLLASVMFIMGLTLQIGDFKRIVQAPKPVAIGVILQFVVMPISALLLANMLQLSNQLTIGMVLVGSCAGGTASNVICYLAKGDVALSISMTLTSTLLGVVLTPLLCTFLLAATVDVDTVAMLLSIIQVVLLPVAGGVLTNHLLSERIKIIEPLLPSISILVILLIISIVVALNAGRLLDVGLLTLVAVILHNLIGFGCGFIISRLLGLSLKQSHTVAIEVGMQNSGLGVTLALQFFSATAALPGAMFSVWHNVSGSLLASYWARKRHSLEYFIREEEQQQIIDKEKS